MFERLGQRLRAYAEKDGRGYPDWALRYVPIAKRLDRCNLQSRTILEVGANANGIARFLKTPDVCIVVTDIDANSLREARAATNVLAVMADAAALPFRDKAFAACLSVDTYEHLPKEKRRLASTEILRTLAKDGSAAIAFPSGPDAEAAESYIRDAYRQYTGGTIRWLEEHREMRLPNVADVERDLTEAAGTTRIVTREDNAPLGIWLWIWRILMCGWPGQGNALAQALLRVATPLLCHVRFGKPYRAMLWIDPPSHK